MKKGLLFAVCFLMVSCAAFAQTPGSIGLFSDYDGMNCDAYDLTTDLVSIYVVHVQTPGATACRFKVDCASYGADLTYIGETMPFPVYYGNTQEGITVPYGACLSSPILVVTVNYFGEGLSPACSYCTVVADPGATPPGIYVADCTWPEPNLLTAAGGTLVINPDASCMCDIPVEETSWGQLKALYQ